MNDPKCLNCAHVYGQHRDDKPRPCKAVLISAWDDKAKAFTSHQPCGCLAFCGPLPIRAVGQAQCPHECLEGSRVCVICKMVAPVRVKQ